MSVITWLVMGFVVGAVAKLIMPGKDPGGLIVTISIGVAGAFIGGYLGNMFGFGSVDGLNAESIMLSTGGALILLGLFRAFKKA